MGLDIYMFRHRKDTTTKGRTFRDQVGYFRKVNFLMDWAGVKGDDDNCRDIYLGGVTRLKELLGKCECLLTAHETANKMFGRIRTEDDAQPLTFEGEDINIKDAVMAMIKAETDKPESEYTVEDYINARPDIQMAMDTLPTQAGFFYGSTSYGEWYFDDVKDVRDWAAKTIAESEEDDDYYLHAWW